MLGSENSESSSFALLMYTENDNSEFFQANQSLLLRKHNSSLPSFFPHPRGQ